MRSGDLIRERTEHVGVDIDHRYDKSELFQGRPDALELAEPGREHGPLIPVGRCLRWQSERWQGPVLPRAGLSVGRRARRVVA